jgi:hypothetical protein
MISQILNKTPPCLCRLLARKNHGRTLLTVREIADRSGLSRALVGKLGTLSSWEGIRVGDMVKFTYGCGVDPLRMRRQKQFAKNSMKSIIRNATPAQLAMISDIFDAIKRASH